MLNRVLIPSLLACFMISCKAKPTEAPKAESKPAPTKDQAAASGDHGHHSAHAKAEESAKPTTPPPVKRVYFVSPKAGDKVKSPVKLVFGVEGMGIRKAGEDVNDQTTGHHHIIVDGAFVPKGTPVPADATHIHYGKGQTETELTLTPGKHTLTMQLADGAHRSYGEGLSTTIEVEVTQ